MRIIHTGLCSSSEKKADLFFQEILGLNKTGPVILTADLCMGVFGINKELRVINYKSEAVHFEVFIDASYHTLFGFTVAHTCLEVENMAKFLTNCTEKGLGVRRIPKGDSFVIFISDHDGNLFEIKERKTDNSIRL